MSRSEIEAEVETPEPPLGGKKPARRLRAYQKLIVDSQAGTLVLHWARQWRVHDEFHAATGSTRLTRVRRAP